ncbi:hypothetical protein [Glycomyces tenuis]|uniref:hypothetical protein n=1 Tax=Glycomyces tenuis TaxID=58116 RepID=UPI0003F86BEC|nr:hypothetical protein [Glycomyces tenuis]
MGDRISYSPEHIREVGETVCPDIANFYDDVGYKAAEAGRVGASVFGDHGLGETWTTFFNLYYDVVYETGSNTRAMGRTLTQIAEDQEILEGELVNTFGQMESEIDAGGYTSTPSTSYPEAPLKAPAPEDKDENPYTAELGGPVPGL